VIFRKEYPAKAVHKQFIFCVIKITCPAGLFDSACDRGAKEIYTKSLLVLYNAECKSGGVQKLSKAVFCTRQASHIGHREEISNTGSPLVLYNPEECRN